MWFYRIILKIAWTERVNNMEVLTEITIGRKLGIRIGNRADIHWTHNEEEGFGTLNPHGLL